jgi:hypothetical protein
MPLLLQKLVDLMDLWKRLGLNLTDNPWLRQTRLPWKRPD